MLSKRAALSMYKILATFILIYLIFRILTTWVFPGIVKWYLKRYKDRFYRENPHLRPDEHQKQEGDIHIRYKKDHNRPDSGKIGEYVDYEEIKDNNKKQ